MFVFMYRSVKKPARYRDSSSGEEEEDEKENGGHRPPPTKRSNINNRFQFTCVL